MTGLILAAWLALASTGVLGHATWYATGPGSGVAAAGPELRAALGSHWRGKLVRVCRGDTRYPPCVYVRLRDWCRCPVRHRLIDLAPGDFRRLGRPLSRGVVTVRVYPTRGGV